MTPYTEAELAYYRLRRLERKQAPLKVVPKAPRTTAKGPKPAKRVIGIDGEGQGRSPHLYTFLAAGDEHGESWSTEDEKGLSTYQCLDFILTLPKNSLVVGYAFQYDLTKILKDLPDDLLYDLFHEKRRAFKMQGREQFKPIHWRGFKLNMLNRKFTVSRQGMHSNTWQSVTIWDIFRFFQGKFTAALSDWKVCDQSVIDGMVKMKDQRGEFDKLPWAEVKGYCKGECLQLARLCRSLIDAHKAAGLELTSYYGAGSTASVFLKRIGIADKRGTAPAAMRIPVACAFFGGRFENSVIGRIKGPVYNADISSAYPYQIYHLPCLEHGKWSYAKNPTTSEIRKATLALIHWRSMPAQPGRAWGAFPVRDNKSNTIAFPLSGLGGWTWKEEWLEGNRLHGYQANEAWLYHTLCDCRPFKEIAEIYRERVRVGKEGKGIVLKLAANSVYGKTAQSQGTRPPFQSWIWAGNITSGTRAQLLQSLDGTKRDWDVLMFATDGVFSTRPINFPKPKDTGTSDLEKPLGGWEVKTIESGVFCSRPGIYFPLDLAENPSDSEVKAIRARGLGKKVLFEKWPEIVRAFDAGEKTVTLGNITRFVGAKTGMSRGEKSGVKRSPNYGEWIPYPITSSFDPRPKRAAILPDGKLRPFRYLARESWPYMRALIQTDEPDEVERLIADEQPDGEYAEEEAT